MAEETGLIDPIGARILQQAYADAAKRPRHFKLPPEQLESEITETALFKSEMDYATLIRSMRNLRVSICSRWLRDRPLIAQLLADISA